MIKMRTLASPQNLIIGTFLFLVAVVAAVSPLPILYRSLLILASAFAAFSTSGISFSYLIVLIAPTVGLITNNPDWLIMLPLMLSPGLLSMLGLEFAWRYWALLVSPLLYALPLVFVWQASHRELFAVSLPWEPGAGLWIALHSLVALAGVLVAVYLDRRREKLEA